MSNFIEELYYGNIDLQSRSTEQNPTVQKATKTLSTNEDLLSELLSEKEKKLFLEYVNAWGLVNGESNLDSFIVGFRWGAKFTYDTFISTDTPFKEITK